MYTAKAVEVIHLERRVPQQTINQKSTARSTLAT